MFSFSKTKVFAQRGDSARLRVANNNYYLERINSTTTTTTTTTIILGATTRNIQLGAQPSQEEFPPTGARILLIHRITPTPSDPALLRQDTTHSWSSTTKFKQIVISTIFLRDPPSLYGAYRAERGYGTFPARWQSPPRLA